MPARGFSFSKHVIWQFLWPHCIVSNCEFFNFTFDFLHIIHIVVHIISMFKTVLRIRKLFCICTLLEVIRVCYYI